MASFDVILGIVESTWNLSVELSPFIFLAFLLLYHVEKGDSWDYVSASIGSQNVLALYLGPYLVWGLLAGGIIHYFIPGDMGIYAGTGAVLLAGIYSFTRAGIPEVEVPFQGFISYLNLAWLSVPLLSIVALLGEFVLLKHLLALLFYSIVFWEPSFSSYDITMP